MLQSEKIFTNYPEEFTGLNSDRLAGKRAAIFYRACESNDAYTVDKSANWKKGWDDGNALWETGRGN